MKFEPVQIGWDYDEPIFAWYDYAHTVSVAAGLAKEEDPPPTNWDPTTTYGCTLDEWYEVLNNEVLKGADGMYAWPLKPGIVQKIKRLYKAGHGIHIITARGQFGDYGADIQKLTRRQLLLEGLPHDSLHFVEDKVPIALELGLDYFIDDRGNHFEALNDAGVNCYLLDERWNQDVDARKFDPIANRVVDKRLRTVDDYIRLIINRHGWRSDLTFAQKVHVSPGTSY